MVGKFFLAFSSVSLRRCVCVCVCVIISLCSWVIFVYVNAVYWLYGSSFLCLTGCFSMIFRTPTVLSVLYACIFYSCICTCSARLSMFHTEKRSRNTLITIIIIIIALKFLSCPTHGRTDNMPTGWTNLTDYIQPYYSHGDYKH